MHRAGLSRAAALFAFMSAASAALAGEFPHTALLGMGFVEARLADFTGTPGFAARRAAPDGLLALSADLNGDGRTDEVRILRNRDRGTARVVATIMTGQLDTYVLRETSFDQAADIGLRLAPRAGERPGVTIFSLAGGPSETLYLTGDEFRDAAGR
jgi:hypothetical protein